MKSTTDSCMTGSILPETSSVPSVNISRVKEESCPVKLERLERLSVKLLLSQEDILKEKLKRVKQVQIYGEAVLERGWVMWHSNQNITTSLIGCPGPPCFT